jgi:thymidylate synthase (FAD)
MRIEYLHHTPLKVMGRAAAMPYQSEPTPELVRRVWDKGHRSIARHGMISFAVYNVSVSLLTQISRHPHINLTVMSSRYCDMSARKTVIPPFVGRGIYKDIYNDMQARIMEWYKYWIDNDNFTDKQKHEIAKMFLPKASTVDLVVSGNYQAVYEFLQLRLCDRAEWEINRLANKMLKICKDKMPVLFADCGPKCDTCKEPCHKNTAKNGIQLTR